MPKYKPVKSKKSENDEEKCCEIAARNEKVYIEPHNKQTKMESKILKSVIGYNQTISKHTF